MKEIGRTEIKEEINSEQSSNELINQQKYRESFQNNSNNINNINPKAYISGNSPDYMSKNECIKEEANSFSKKEEKVIKKVSEIVEIRNVNEERNKTYHKCFTEDHHNKEKESKKSETIQPTIINFETENKISLLI